MNRSHCLAVERPFGLLELHSSDGTALERAGQVILRWMGAKAEDPLRPQLLFSEILVSVADQRAVLMNRTRQGSMESLTQAKNHVEKLLGEIPGR
jgi:hypothetical protein